MTEDEDTRRGRSSENPEVFGPIDAGALREIRDLAAEAEPLVEAASLDDSLNPQTLSIELADGVGDASAARLDVRWSLTGNYAVHYTDDRGRDFRFDRHPKPDAPTRHFHPPPDAPSRPVEQSCITVSEVGLVTRAALQRWRYAYENGTFEGVNDAENPP
ncbi:hypothetical protein NGM10_14125 [Halorussus salilacus]|uniref:hypothetical protein n=1 Tax=Halorussus salilacus TaxID=2953750 RepID=UPI00209F93F5|nr:hypothetical protein [Halorussus salilacus]USZ67858.1 hypothetical protein NGM10_14125 [Halorussus salilacus]